MKKLSCGLLSIFLSLSMFFQILPSAFATESQNPDIDLTDYSVGDVITFGSYPCSEVKDDLLLEELNKIPLEWISYGYYSGTDDWDDGNMQPVDYMKYCDVTYGEFRYRAVKFSSYRPPWSYVWDESKSYQDDNGYYIDNVYWFKYEPLKWKVLDPEEGFVMCEEVIDAQLYNNTIYYDGNYYYRDKTCTDYANNYVKSSIREWLNETFYNTAFNDTEKSEIYYSYCDNSAKDSSDFGCEATYDKIFLPSYCDVKNSLYGFSSDESVSDEALRAQATDYAKCQGLFVSSRNDYYGNVYWYLRTPSALSGYSCCVGFTGYAGNRCSVDYTRGVRPALKFNPETGYSDKSDWYFKGINGCVVDSDNKLIYGINEGTSSLKDYIDCGGCEYRVSGEYSNIGTGTLVEVLVDGKTEEIYTIVIFGDVTGDGYIDAFDMTALTAVANYEEEYAENSAYYIAGDLTDDGYIDSYDVTVITSATNFEYEIPQIM